MTSIGTSPTRRRHLPPSADEAPGRWELAPEKFEMYAGKLFWDEAQRLTLLALLLENVGVDQAVRVGDAEVWRTAVRELE